MVFNNIASVICYSVPEQCKDFAINDLAHAITFLAKTMIKVFKIFSNDSSLKSCFLLIGIFYLDTCVSFKLHFV